MATLIGNGEPLYMQLKNRLAEEILTGKLEPGAVLLPEREMCRSFGVSQITVRAALRELQAQGLVVRIHGRGTFVAEQAKAPDARSRTIGFLVNDSKGTEESPFMMQLLGGVKSVVLQTGLKFSLLMDSDCLEAARDGALDGIIVPEPQGALVLMSELADFDTRMVVIGHPHSQRIVSVDSDNFSVGFELANHLLANGFCRIGFIGYPETFCQDRMKGYKQALHGAGISVKHSWLALGESSPDFGRAETEELLAADVDAIIGADDMIAGNILAVLREKGISVPDEVGVVGCNNTILVRYLHPSLTSMELFPELLGSMAATRLLQLMRQEKTELRTMFKGQLEIRESSVRKVLEKRSLPTVR